MREPPPNGAIPIGGTRAKDAPEYRRGQASERAAEEPDRQAMPLPPPLSYRDESPDAVRRQPEGWQSVAGEARDSSERVNRLNLTGQARQKLRGRLFAAAGAVGTLMGQLLGSAIQASIAAEALVRRLAERAQRDEEAAGERIEIFSTEAGHEAQERAGRIGMVLSEARARGRALAERSPIELSPRAAGVVGVLIGLVGLGGVVLLRVKLRQRETERDTERHAEAEAQAETVVEIPQAMLPPLDGASPGEGEVIVVREMPPRGLARWWRQRRQRSGERDPE